MKTLDNSNISLVRRKVQAALDQVAQELGMKIELGNISYNAQTFKSSIQGKITSGDLETDLRNQFEIDSRYTSWTHVFGAQFVDEKGETHTIVGYDTRAKKYPILTAKGTKIAPATQKWTARYIASKDLILETKK